MPETASDLEIVTYPHPILRRPSKTVQRIDRGMHEIVARMFELMYEARGVGLAANQVDLPLRICVINPSGKKGDGEEWVLINPVIDRPKGSAEGEEGCLSLPGIFAPVMRPKQVRLSAYDLAGNAIDRVVEGYLARIVQHEVDHLDGVMFIDRLRHAPTEEIEDRLDELRLEFESRQRAGSIPSDGELIDRLAIWEQRYA
jgi:peptide deformylase